MILLPALGASAGLVPRQQNNNANNNNRGGQNRGGAAGGQNNAGGAGAGANAGQNNAGAGGAAGAGAGANGGQNNGGNAGNAGNAGGDPQKSLTLDPKVVATGFANNGQDVPTEGQVASLTSTNNFINFCLTVPNLPITNGKQITTGSCNPAPIGIIPSVDNMPSSKFTNPKNGQTIEPNKAFTISMAVKNLQTGAFVNAQANYFAAPQQLNGQGQIIGHSHVVVEKLQALDQTTPTNPKQFAFFKGLNAAAQGGVLTADVAAGLPAGAYRLCSINTSSNHQPAIVPVAQHGSLDDCVYFTAAAGGAAAGGAGAANGGNAGGAANGGNAGGAANGGNAGGAANGGNAGGAANGGNAGGAANGGNAGGAANGGNAGGAANGGNAGGAANGGNAGGAAAGGAGAANGGKGGAAGAGAGANGGTGGAAGANNAGGARPQQGGNRGRNNVGAGRFPRPNFGAARGGR